MLTKKDGKAILKYQRRVPIAPDAYHQCYFHTDGWANYKDIKISSISENNFENNSEKSNSDKIQVDYLPIFTLFFPKS